MRDLKADQALCDAATVGPWNASSDEWPGNDNLQYWVNTHWDGILCAGTFDDARFASEARTGWPHAIRRALDAEAEVERLKAIIADKDVYQRAEEFETAYRMAEDEVERLRCEVSSLCPTGDFDVITSLRAELTLAREQLADWQDSALASDTEYYSVRDAFIREKERADRLERILTDAYEADERWGPSKALDIVEAWGDEKRSKDVK